MTGIQKRRLLRLADYLAGPVYEADKAARKRGRYKFEMGSWCEYNNVEGLDDDRTPRKVGLSKNLCNTAACALGWATTLWPDRLNFTRDGFVKFDRKTDNAHELAREFFGLNEQQTDEAFFGYGSAKEVAGILRRIAKEGTRT